MKNHEMLEVLNRLGSLNQLALSVSTPYAYHPVQKERRMGDTERIFSRLKDLETTLQRLAPKHRPEVALDEDLQKMFVDSMSAPKYLNPYTDVGLYPLPVGYSEMKEIAVDLSAVSSEEDMFQAAIAAYPHNGQKAPYLLVTNVESEFLKGWSNGTYRNAAVPGTDVTSLLISREVPGVFEVWCYGEPEVSVEGDVVESVTQDETT